MVTLTQPTRHIYTPRRIRAVHIDNPVYTPTCKMRRGVYDVLQVGVYTGLSMWRGNTVRTGRVWFSVNDATPRGVRAEAIVRAHRFGQLGVLVVRLVLGVLVVRLVLGVLVVRLVLGVLVVRLVRARLHYHLVACERKGACVAGLWRRGVVMA